MVQISRSNITRRFRGNGNGTILGQLQTYADSLSYLARLSPADRMLVVVGASLLCVVSVSYFVLISGIFVSYGGGPGGGGGNNADPRLSSDLRRIGLSEEALLRRGGGRRISVGDKRLDSVENAVALDISKTLDCDALQEEMDREWQKVLDDARPSENSNYKPHGGSDNNYKPKGYVAGGYKAPKEGDGSPHKSDGRVEKDWEAGMADDYAAELAAEVGFGRSKGGGRRLQEGTDDYGRDDLNRFDQGKRDYYSYKAKPPGLKLTAKHLFCLVAESLTLPKSPKPSVPDPATECGISSFEVRDELFSLWSSARSQMPEDVIKKALGVVTEHKETLRGKEVHIWYPENDKGTEGMLRVLNSGYDNAKSYNFDSEPADTSHDNLYRFHDLPPKFVGPNKLFVDVGSALGLTPMLISQLYPETTVVSIEPASPSWLIQNINFRCNLPRDRLQYVHSILAGVGTKHHDDNDSMMKMIWRPSMTTATRSWNPEREFDYAVDIELTVHLRTLKAILAEATPEDLPMGTPVSVLNLDCEGCEYNLIPSMHETTFNSIGLILGRTNWGYIPPIKKPSSVRARETHQRVCQHYNFAKRCKECCDFPSLSVKRRIPTKLESGGGGGGGGSPAVDHTVAEVAGELCNDFESWAKDSKLRDIPDDYGWNEMSAFAAEDVVM